MKKVKLIWFTLNLDTIGYWLLLKQRASIYDAIIKNSHMIEVTSSVYFWHAANRAG